MFAIKPACGRGGFSEAEPSFNPNPIAWRCPRCDHLNEPRDKTCFDCGADRTGTHK